MSREPSPGSRSLSASALSRHVDTGHAARDDKIGFALPMSATISVSPKFRPVLDPEFLPASLWNRAYRTVAQTVGTRPLAIALERSHGGVSVFRTAILPHEGGNVAINHRYTERLLKYLLWRPRERRVVE